MGRKGMYLDYNRQRKRGRGKRALIIILILIIAVGAGVGAFFAAGKIFDRINSGNGAGEDILQSADTTGSSEALGENSGEGTDAEDYGGPYGMWYAEVSEETEDDGAEDIYDFSDEYWMSDFVDTRVPVEAKGVYVSAKYHGAKLDYAIDLIDRTELNAIVIDIKDDDGQITYRMDNEIAKEIGATTSAIPDIYAMMAKLKEHNIYAIARVVTLKDPKLAKNKTELALHNKDGSMFYDSSGQPWVNPYKDEVWDYLIDICTECAKVGFNEVNLDYIRFATDKGMANVDFGPGSEERTRIDVITDGIRRICENIKPLGVFVSCDVFGAIITSSVDARIVGQSYFNMGQYLDYICPMVYPSHYSNGYYNLDYPDCHPYDLVYHALMDSQKVLYMIDADGNKAKVRPWLQDFTASWVTHHLNYGAKELRDQINAVYDAGYSEWLLWNAAVKYSEDGLLGPEE